MKKKISAVILMLAMIAALCFSAWAAPDAGASEGGTGGGSAPGAGGAGGPGGAGGGSSSIEDIDVEVEAFGEGISVVLKGAKLLDKNYNGEVLDVKVQDGYITEVGENLEGDEVIDLSGCTLMPGLIDSHVHVAGSAGYNLQILKYFCTQGITSVREEGMLSTENEEDFLPLIDDVSSDPAYAYLLSCGKYLDETGGYGMGPTGNMGIVVTNAEEAATEIEHKAELGYTQVKIGINSDENRLSADEIAAIIETAHANKMPVAAHINYVVYLEELAEAGIDEAAHTPNDEMPDELISLMVEKGISMNTSGSETDENIKIENLKKFYEAGGFITVGTDKMRGYDTSIDSLIAEMQVLAKAGLSIQEVITCTTYNNAQAISQDTGAIEEGLQADLIAVQGDVDETFESLKELCFIMNDGALIK